VYLRNGNRPLSAQTSKADIFSRDPAVEADALKEETIIMQYREETDALLHAVTTSPETVSERYV